MHVPPISWALIEFRHRGSNWEPSRKRARRLTAASAVRASIQELAFGAGPLGLIGIYRPPPLTSTAMACVGIASFVSVPFIL